MVGTRSPIPMVGTHIAISMVGTAQLQPTLATKRRLLHFCAQLLHQQREFPPQAPGASQ